MLKKLLLSTALVAGIAFAPTAALAGTNDNYADVGKLVCHKTGDGVNILIHSQFPISCTYTDHDGKKEDYTGSTGVALGVTLSDYDKVDISFVVLAIGKFGAGNRAMVGNYIGGHVSAAVGSGAGVDVLLGGGANNVALQPIAGEVNKGIGVSAGLGFLSLK